MGGHPAADHPRHRARSRPRTDLPLLSADVLNTNPIWLCFAYVILVMPFAFRALAVGLNSIDVKTLCEASRSLGASWPRVFFRVLILTCGSRSSPHRSSP